MLRFRNEILTLFTCMLLQGCSSVRTGPVPVEDRSKAAAVEDVEQKAELYGPHRPGEAPAGRDAENRSGRMSPAVVALLDEAGAAESKGRFESASATLERAIRIDSKNAVPWNRLARIRLAQGKLQQALTLARRSNSLAAGNYPLQLDNWLLILQVKEKVRDVQGIENARKKIEQLRKRDVRSEE